MLPTVTSKKKFEPEMGPQPEKKKKKRKATKRIYVDTHKMPQEIIEEENQNLSAEFELKMQWDEAHHNYLKTKDEKGFGRSSAQGRVLSLGKNDIERPDRSRKDM